MKAYLISTGMIVVCAMSVSSATADDAGLRRVRAARDAMLEVSENSEEFVGRRFEGVCPIAEIDIGWMTCVVKNTNGATVGHVLVSLSKLPSRHRVPLLNECVRELSSDEEIKPACTVYFRGKIDSDTVIYAIETERFSYN